MVVAPRDRVDAEGDPGRVRPHHPLHQHREREAGLGEPVGAAVRERGVRAKRAPGALDRGEDVVDADHVQHGLVLAGEGRGRAVLVERGGAHRDGRRGLTVGPEACVRLGDGAAQLVVDPAVRFGAPMGLGREAEAGLHGARRRERAEVGGLGTDERRIRGARIFEGYDERAQRTGVRWVMGASKLRVRGAAPYRMRP